MGQEGTWLDRWRCPGLGRPFALVFQGWSIQSFRRQYTWRALGPFAQGEFQTIPRQPALPNPSFPGIAPNAPGSIRLRWFWLGQKTHGNWTELPQSVSIGWQTAASIIGGPPRRLSRSASAGVRPHIAGDQGRLGQIRSKRSTSLTVLATFYESVASLPGIVVDALNVLPYFLGSNCTTEGGHVGTGRIPSRLYGGNHSCRGPAESLAGAAQSQLFAAAVPEVRSKLLPRSHFRADAARPRRLGAGATS